MLNELNINKRSSEMDVLNLDVVKELDFTAEDIAEYASAYLPDEQNDGEFDEFMHEVVNDIAYDMDAEVDMCDAFYDTYPTKEVEEFMAENMTLEQAIVAYLESKIEYIKDWA
tara:strand:+ start:542 stop:880 length:339 start_codon:yes stop_codon:yes gene_type:complete